MRHCLSSLPNIKTIPYFNTSINCDSNCHLPEDCNNDDFLTLTSRLNNCFSPYPMRSIIKSTMCEEKKIIMRDYAFVKMFVIVPAIVLLVYAALL